jgi:hypothetical protein
MSKNGGRFKGNGVATVSGSYDRNVLSARVKLPAGSGYAAFTFQNGGAKYYAGLVRKDGGLYLTVTRDITNPTGGGGVYVGLADPGLTEFDLKIFSEGKFIEAFVNDEYAVTAHTALGGGLTVGLACGGGAAEISGAAIYKMSDYYNIFD